MDGFLACPRALEGTNVRLLFPVYTDIFFKLELIFFWCMIPEHHSKLDTSYYEYSKIYEYIVQIIMMQASAWILLWMYLFQIQEIL